MKRKILSDDAYPNCNLDEETSHHALWSCPALASSWEVHFVWLIVDSRNCRSFLDVIQLCQEKSNLTKLFAMTASLIQFRKNQICVGEAAVPLGKINSMAVDNLQEFQRASSSPQTTPSVAQESKWLPPPTGWLKINFDGATFKVNNLASLGAIVRNDKGLVMAAFTQTIPLPTSVEMVEVLAVHSAICFATELNLEQVIVEGDSEIIIKAINSGGFASSSFGHIIRDIKLSSSSFHNLSFCYTRRQGNRIAHKLARFGISFYIKIFFLYVDFILDESNTGSRISILTGNGFHQNVKSLICIINNTLYYILLVVLELGPYV